jgi:hypothetical protein
LNVSWAIPSSKIVATLILSWWNLISILSGSWNSVATCFFQGFNVSSGKNSESLQDPYWICQGSSTKRPKIFPRGVGLSAQAQIPLSNNDKKIVFIWSLVDLFRDPDHDDVVPSGATYCWEIPLSMEEDYRFNTFTLYYSVTNIHGNVDEFEKMSTVIKDYW